MMSKTRAITATILVASLASGCSVISQVNNARSAYQGVQAYKTAKGMADAQPAFENASAFSVTAKLMPRDEEKAAEIEQTFTQLAIEETLKTAEKLDLDLAYCEITCPADTVRIQFNEKGREGLVEKFAMGDQIGGELYLTKNGEILEQSTLDVGQDYASVAQSLTTAINLRLVKTAQADTQKSYQNGQMSDEEAARKSEAIMDLMNGDNELDGPLIELLKDKT